MRDSENYFFRDMVGNLSPAAPSREEDAPHSDNLPALLSCKHSLSSKLWTFGNSQFDLLLHLFPTPTGACRLCDACMGRGARFSSVVQQRHPLSAAQVLRPSHPSQNASCVVGSWTDVTEQRQCARHRRSPQWKARVPSNRQNWDIKDLGLRANFSPLGFEFPELSNHWPCSLDSLTFPL